MVQKPIFWIFCLKTFLFLGKYSLRKLFHRGSTVFKKHRGRNKKFKIKNILFIFLCCKKMFFLTFFFNIIIFSRIKTISKNFKCFYKYLGSGTIMKNKKFKLNKNKNKLWTLWCAPSIPPSLLQSVITWISQHIGVRDLVLLKPLWCVSGENTGNVPPGGEWEGDEVPAPRARHAHSSEDYYDSHVALCKLTLPHCSLSRTPWPLVVLAAARRPGPSPGGSGQRW